jgi:uncharacterized protein YjbI with pentapeptide repeats
VRLRIKRRREARNTEANRTRETREIEKGRIQEARAIEERRAQEAALQQYFEQIGQLLRQGLDRSYRQGIRELLERPLLKPHEKNDEERKSEERQLRLLAEVQTYRMLQSLAPERKWLLLQFLYDANLLNRAAPVLNLAEADLRGAILAEYMKVADAYWDEALSYLPNAADPTKYLSKDDLSAVLESTDAHLDAFLEFLAYPGAVRASLEEADLSRVNLIGSYLRNVLLSSPNLRDAYLDDADMIQADLSNAYLGGAWLQDAVLLAANLNAANLNRVHSSGAVFVKAELTTADLYEADLRGANLKQADLSGANLVGADLSNANLSNATVTHGQLHTAKSLNGTIMPDGTKLP